MFNSLFTLIAKKISNVDIVDTLEPVDSPNNGSVISMTSTCTVREATLHKRHNECQRVSYHQRLDCLFSRLFRLTSKEIPKRAGTLRGEPSVADGFPLQRAGNAESGPGHNVIMRSLSQWHYSDVIMSAIASQITSITIVYSTVYSGRDQRKHQSSESLAFVRGMDSPHKGPVTREKLPFDDVIMGTTSPSITIKLTGCPSPQLSRSLFV